MELDGSATCRIENPTAITANSVPLFEDIVVYPNPASDFLQFDINISSPSVISVYIYNNLGVLVMHSSSYHLSQGKNEIVLQLDELEQPGSYYYRIFIDGETGYTGRFVKL